MNGNIEREIIDSEEIRKILKEAKLCHLGFIDVDEPYIVPVNYGYMENNIYFHFVISQRLIKFNSLIDCSWKAIQ